MALISEAHDQHLDYLIRQLQAADELLRTVQSHIGRHGRDHDRQLDQAAMQYDRLRKIRFELDP